MDTSDPEIVFDENGICNHCTSCIQAIREHVFSGVEANRKLHQLVEVMKRAGKGKPYDCLIGVSGGVDSTYLAMKVKEFGLRPLALHLDNGWDSELAVSNIEKTLRKLNIDLHTCVINWKEFRNLQVAFLRASTPDSEIPTDHAIVASLYETANKYNIKYIISGINFSTEGILPAAWSHGHYDWKYIHSINSQFGAAPLETYPHYSFIQFLKYIFIKKIKVVFPLNYMEYNKEAVVSLLESELGWRNYSGKHYESKYTRFFQAYILPTKFGFDKRRAHLSTLICSQQLSREEALRLVQEPLYDKNELVADTEFVEKKLNLSTSEFQNIITAPKKTFHDYPSYEKDAYYRLFYAIARQIRIALQLLKRKPTSHV